MTNHIEAARARRDGGVLASADRPTQRRCGQDEGSLRGAPVPTAARAKFEGDGSPHVVGMASITERGYEMWDMFGPYTEVVSLGAFDKTLAANPLVEFGLNHHRGGGAPMAHTRNGTLVLSVTKEGEESGLAYDADVDQTRTDVSDMLKALERGDLAESSFKFRIVAGLWSPDYTEYRIEEVDLDRGDVSAVNFGANPYATSGVRAEAAPRVRGVDRVTDADLLPARSLI